MPPITETQIDDMFTYHDDPAKIPQYQNVRDAAKEFAKILVKNTPVSPDQSAAVRLLRQCVMTANAAIALDGRY